jgi:multimeric flavodoxin WrbA
MKITVVNGNQRHGSTWNCKELFLRELSRADDVETKEFTLPKDMPHFCAGCFSCFFNGEQTCPHSESVSPIVKALEEADLVIFTSPVYAMDVSGPMKSLLDHLCFMWMSHRPNPRMFRKVGLIITTTAGAGSSHARKTLKNSMRFWGVNRIFSFNPSVSAMKWDDVEPQKKVKLERLIKKQSVRIERAVKNAGQAPWNPVSALLFRIMRSMMRKNTWNPYDRSHWEQNGWL